MFKNLSKKIIFLFTRVGVVYLLIFFILNLFPEYKNTIDLAQLRILNRFVPFSFQCLIEPEKKFGANHYQAQIDYYNQVVKLAPEVADIYEIFGFCYYHLGDKGKAIASFKKAIQLERRFFWAQYDLGLIYYQNKHYSEAIKVFQKATNLPPEAAFLIIKASSIYQQIILINPDIHYDFNGSLKRGYHDAYVLLVKSYYALKDFQNMLSSSLVATKLGVDDNGVFYFYQGLAAYHLKQYDLSVYALQETIKKSPDFDEAYYYLALSLQALGREDLATRMMQKGAFLHNAKPSPLFDENNVVLKIF